MLDLLQAMVLMLLVFLGMFVVFVASLMYVVRRIIQGALSFAITVAVRPIFRRRR